GLPENLFYNTGIRTYIWVLSNEKPEAREDKVQLIDAQDLYAEMDESLGEKRHELAQEHIDEISRVFGDLEANGRSKVVPTEEFGYRRIVIDRPLRMSFRATEERIESLDDERAFTNRDEETQEAVKEALRTLDDDKQWMDRDEFINDVELAFNMQGVEVRNSVYNAIERALGEQNDDAEIVTDSKGSPDHDSDRRMRERVPLGTDPRNYFEEEVSPYLENAWINESSKYHDDQDGGLGVVGYEINFRRYFETYESPRTVSQIDSEISDVESNISQLLEKMGIRSD
ncbi:N-6 DNA methylase, partial [Haloarcula sp. AONF1]